MRRMAKQAMLRVTRYVSVDEMLRYGGVIVA